MPRLHAAEGVGAGYDLDERTFDLPGGGRQAAVFYRATHVDPALPPCTWCRALVVAGAVEQRLPATYVAALAAVRAVDDPDIARAAPHWRLAAGLFAKASGAG